MSNHFKEYFFNFFFSITLNQTPTGYSCPAIKVGRNAEETAASRNSPEAPIRPGTIRQRKSRYKSARIEEEAWAWAAQRKGWCLALPLVCLTSSHQLNGKDGLSFLIEISIRLVVELACPEVASHPGIFSPTPTLLSLVASVKCATLHVSPSYM